MHKLLPLEPRLLMSDKLSERVIVRVVADQAARRIAHKAIAELQQMEDTTSGDDSVLKSIWDEVCVQIQHEQSIFWGAYDQTVQAILADHVAELSKHEREAIWLQTSHGGEWSYDKNEDREPSPVCNDDIVEYLAREFVYREAGTWSNARIRAYLDRQE